MNQIVGILGIGILLGIAFLLSENKKNITQKTISNLMGNKPELRFEFIREKANLSNNLVS